MAGVAAVMVGVAAPPRTTEEVEDAVDLPPSGASQGNCRAPRALRVDPSDREVGKEAAARRNGEKSAWKVGKDEFYMADIGLDSWAEIMG